MRRVAASTLLSLLCIAAIYLICDNNSEILREEGTAVGPDDANSALRPSLELEDGTRQAFVEVAVNAARQRRSSSSHDPSEVEARALKAVSRTKQAAQALQSAREAVVRLQQLGDTPGAAAALQAEQQAKRAFISARTVSAPLVAEARANYEATQGSEIQQVAKQVAQDTWRTMTGMPMSTRDATNTAPDSATSIGSREAAVSRATMKVADQYVRQAHDAQWRAIQAQRITGGQSAKGSEGVTGPDGYGQAPAYAPGYPPGYPPVPPAVAYGQGLGTVDGGNDVTAVARYAKQAHDAMMATKEANDMMQQQLEAMKKQRAELAAATAAAAAKNASITPESQPTSAEAQAEDVISNAEQDVASSMRTVEEAAQQRGLADNSWKNRIGDMLKNGQSAEANQAAKAYVQDHVNNAASAAMGDSVVDDAAKQVEEAQNTIQAASRSGPTSIALP